MTELENAVLLVKQKRHDINGMSRLIAGSYPCTAEALKILDYEKTRPKRRKGFSLVKIESKKHGFLYYARFSHNGKTLPSKWNTRTNNLEEAERFARENKASLVEAYLGRHDGMMYMTLEGFYDGNDNLPAVRISERCRKEYQAIIIKKFIPYLKSEKIKSFEQITKTALNKFQDGLLNGGAKPQTVNNNMKAVRKLLCVLARRGVIKDNPGDQVKGIPVHETDQKARGCYELDRLKGVFNKRWEERTPHLLAMLIYTTGMRNGEIKRMRADDIVSIGGCRFIRINESKTASGVRMVPLHDFVYRKLKEWALRNNKEREFFDFNMADAFNHANTCLGLKLGMSEEEIGAENITYYSGRHFWKTLMSREGLGEDIEEVFMGHKVKGDIRKRYNHRDRQGRESMVRKARQVLSILDRCVFEKNP
jgi:integrase